MSKTKRIIWSIEVCMLVLATTKIYAFNYYPQFYEPRTFFGEPRLARSWLTTINATLRCGRANDGYNSCGTIGNILNCYGNENIAMIGKGVPASILSCNPSCIFNTAWQYHSYNTQFGKVTVTGDYSALEFLPVITQNFEHGFFISLSIPIKKERIRNLFYDDHTTYRNIACGLNYIEWQQAINSIEEQICAYGTYIGKSRSRGLGDIQLFGGWTLNYEDTTVIDYIDCSLAAGINFPTSPHRASNFVWCLPLGYEEHTGIPIIVAVSLGLFDWFTIGVQTGGMWFNKKRRMIPIKTAYEQEGWIRLTNEPATVKKGAIWHIDEYIKLDHIIGGFSVIVGFSHDHANQSYITCIEQSPIDCSIANSDDRLKPWTMTAFNFLFEFDFATFEHPNAPHIAFTVDKVIHGKRVFDSSLFGASCSVDW